jgi:hypothetical protein
MTSVPHLNPAVEWRELDSGLILAVYRRGGPFWHRWLRRIFLQPETGELLLDEPGSRVIRAINGERTLEELVAWCAKEFRLSRKEAEVATHKYINLLAARRLAGFELKADKPSE